MKAIHGDDIKLLALGSEAKRFIYEMEKKGMEIPAGNNFAACTDKQLNSFLSWRELHRQQLGDSIIMELSPFLRRFLHDQPHFNTARLTYLGDSWVKMSIKDYHTYNTYNEELRTNTSQDLENRITFQNWD